MAKLVVDTNVVVSAFTSSNIAAPALCLDIILTGKHQIVLTQEIVEEYEAVLTRPKFGIELEIIREFFLILDRICIYTTPDKRFILCADKSDNIFLDAAYSENTDYIITGNIGHFPKACSFVDIVSAREFINLQANMENRSL